MPLRFPATSLEPPYHACVFVDTRAPGDDGLAARAEEMVKLAEAQPGFLGLDSVRDADGLAILVSYWRDEPSVTAWREHAAHAATRTDGPDRHWYEAFTVHIAKVERAYRFTPPITTKNLSFPDRHALVRTLDEIERLPSRHEM
jgi:heme-degrading monooxygenase HmoA